ncbi:MAG: hypothetical protein WC415_04355 [Patescibacteria group bacterium]
MVMLDDLTVGFTTHHLAIALDTDEKYIKQLLQRNHELFDDSTFRCKMHHLGAMRVITCLKKDAVITLVTLLDYHRYPENKKQRIISFRKWSSKVIVDVIEGKISDDVITWIAERKIAKMLYHTLTDAVKEKCVPENASEKEKRMIYGKEANLINLVVFGKKANGVNQRNTATSDQLRCLNRCQGVLPGLVLADIPYNRRLEILQEVVDKIVIESMDDQKQLS